MFARDRIAQFLQIVKGKKEAGKGRERGKRKRSFFFSLEKASGKSGGADTAEKVLDVSVAPGEEEEERNEEGKREEALHGSTGSVVVALLGHATQNPLPLGGIGRRFSHHGLKQRKVRVVIPVGRLLGHRDDGNAWDCLMCPGNNTMRSRWLEMEGLVARSQNDVGNEEWEEEEGRGIAKGVFKGGKASKQPLAAARFSSQNSHQSSLSECVALSTQ